WIDGGATDAENLLLLCSHHHRLVHDGHWTITGTANGAVTYQSPDGRTLDEQPLRAFQADWRTVRDRYRRVTGSSIATATATGERLDLDWTISALCCLIPPDRN
ncbi:MAG: hypothetical protein JWL83_3410, partial [Actinomycetia bacterium]|nr:hypothetical protein [Actinomycetes bacterium]